CASRPRMTYGVTEVAATGLLFLERIVPVKSPRRRAAGQVVADASGPGPASSAVLDVPGSGENETRYGLHHHDRDQRRHRRDPSAGQVVEDSHRQGPEARDQVADTLAERGQGDRPLGRTGPERDHGERERE